jgi:hypothetical protein
VNFADNMPSTFSLTPNSARSIKLVVKVPSSAKDGDKGNFQIDVVSSATKLKKSYSVNISVSTNLPLTIYSDDATGQVGSTVSVPLYLQNANSIRGVSFEVAFNRTNLQFQGATLDESLNDDLLLAKDNGQSIDVAFSSTNGTSISGKALLLNLNFKALKMSTNQLQYNNLYAINVVDIPLEVEGVPSLLSVTPYLSVNFSDNTVSSSQNFQFTGKTTPGCTVTVNGSTVQVKSDGTFSATTSLIYENNTISIISQSTSGEKTVVNRTVFYKGKKTITIKLQIDNPIMTVNGTQMEIDPGRGTVPVIMKGWDRTIVPIRAIVEVIGGTVSWDANARMVLIELKGNSIKLWIDNPVAEVNGQKVAIDPDNNLIKPVIVNSRTYVPLRFVSENLGCTVSWDNSTRTVTIVYSE